MGLMKLIRGMNTKRMLEMAKKVAKDAHKPSPLILCDMVWCGFRYRAGYIDYDLFEFWDLNGPQRSTVLTRGKNDQYVAALNDKKEWNTFDVKPEFLARFAPFIGRKWLDLTKATAKEFEDFGESLGSFIVKPLDACHGDGVEKIEAANVDDWSKLFETLKANGQILCEEIIKQHKDLNAIWPGSVNTIRIVTILKDDKAHVIAAYLRVGNGPRPVDNFNNGGMVTPIDIKTGIIKCASRDKAGVLYEYHPVTGTAFAGTQIPMWQEILDLLEKVALVVPTIRYVGWDIAVTPKGPVVVEGNQYPGHDIYGLPGQNPEKIGILPALDAVVPYKSLK